MLAARRRTRRSQGQALVEFALVLPAMILILLAAIDFGRVFFTYIQVHNAAREAAFAASADPTDLAAIQARAVAEINVQGQGGEGALTVGAPSCATAATPPVPTTCPSAGFTSPPGAGLQVTVAVSRQFTFLTPIIGDLFGSFALGASATAPLVPQEATTAGGGGGGGGGTLPDPCAPLADFTFSQTAWNKGVEFDASDSTPTSGSCSDQIVQYEWDFGDGSATVTQMSPPYPPKHGWPSHKYLKAGGQYNVTLTVTTEQGETASFSQPVLALSK